jgi:hypothetical protein
MSPLEIKTYEVKNYILLHITALFYFVTLLQIFEIQVLYSKFCFRYENNNKIITESKQISVILIFKVNYYDFL